MNTGWDKRLEILKRDANDKILDPLRTHGWSAVIEREVERGEYIIITAERGGARHQVALMYSAATKNAVYKALAQQVEHIFINGDLYKLDSFAYGIETPISQVGDFHHALLKWNKASADGKFAPVVEGTKPLTANPPKHRVLLSEQPIEAIWLRLRQLQSVHLAKKLIRERTQRSGYEIDEGIVQSKAEGLAYALRNATDYFHSAEAHKVSQKVLNLYYGSMSFAFAEMLAAPAGPSTLADIEKITKQGHGLYTVDGANEDLDQLVVGVLATGFFAAWMKALGYAIDKLPSKKARKYADLEGVETSSWSTVERLFARIPEVSDLFIDIFDGAPAWVTPSYDQEANARLSLFDKREPVTRTYVVFVDDSARLRKEDIPKFPGSISEISEVPSEEGGRHFRDAVEHAENEKWWHALSIHHSPFERSALILPVFDMFGEYRALCVTLLYALSIVVRYRPSIWRRVQEGDLDHMRVLIEAFLVVVERVLPEQFLEEVTGQRVFVRQPGSLF